MKTSSISGFEGIWIFAEQEEGCLSEVSLELLSAARCLAERKKAEICAVLLGDGVESLTDPLFAYGAERVILAEHTGLKRYLGLPYTRIVSDLVLKGKPDIFLLPATFLGSDLAA